jgi:endo-1,4-beta-xylanase
VKTTLPIVSTGVHLPLGAAVQYGRLTTPKYADTLTDHFSQVSPENEGKYSFIHQYGFGPMDGIVLFAKNHQLQVHYHTLLWWDLLPPDPLAWITDIMTRYPTIHHWDVVNEGYFPGGEVNIPNIEAAYAQAELARPDALLWYNGILNTPGEQEAVKRLVELELVTGVGIEMHLGLDSDLMVYQDFLTWMRGKVYWRVSELEVAIPDNTPEHLVSQAGVYAEVRQLAEAFGAKSITTWGFTDACSWQPGRHSLPFDEMYQPKPAWEAMV